MARLILVYVGMVQGKKAYAPLDKEDIALVGDHQTIVCETKSNKAVRTILQNRSMHKYFTLLSLALNSAGWDMVKTLSKQVDIPWSSTSIKERLWHPLQQALTQKASTADLERPEVSQVYDILNRHTASKLGVSVPFPDQYQRIIDIEYREAG